MIGDGYRKDKLKKENADIDFLGHVDRLVRDEYVKRSWLIAVPGIREGWGQVVTDSNALGTVSIGYNVPGLRDSIKDGLNGLLVDPTLSLWQKVLKRSLRTVLSGNGLARMQ